MHSYKIPWRMTVSKVYPQKSQRGSEVIVSGYQEGIQILWRGGQRLHPKSSVYKDNDGQEHRFNRQLSLKLREQTTGEPIVTRPIPDADKVCYERDDKETVEDDDEDSAEDFVQEVSISTGSPVLHLTMPTVAKDLSPEEHEWDVNVPIFMHLSIILIAVCADSTVRLIMLPINPPSATAKRNHTLGARICTLKPTTTFARHVPVAVDVTWTPCVRQTTEKPQPFDLLVALSHSAPVAGLDFFRFPLEPHDWPGFKFPLEARPFHSLDLSARADHISFNSSKYPSPKHSQILLADAKGLISIYDPLALDSSNNRPSSRHSAQDIPTSPGAYLLSLNTSFALAKDSSAIYPVLAKRKNILDAQWVSAGRAILVLLADGEWGVWNVDGGGPASLANNSSTISGSFVIRGSIAQGAIADSSAASDSRPRINQGLAPMTPNTRKIRQESLFGKPASTAPGNTHKGGISVALTTTSHGTPDESVVLWYGGEAYHIPSLVSLWQRSVSSSGRDVGSLYGPGLVHIDGLDTSGEILNSIIQLRSVSATGTTHRDILVTTDYHLIIIATPRPQTPAKSLFGGVRESVNGGALDMQLLEKGDLDLGGVDRLLDGMDSIEKPIGFAAYAGKPKRVGFAR